MFPKSDASVASDAERQDGLLESFNCLDAIALDDLYTDVAASGDVARFGYRAAAHIGVEHQIAGFGELLDDPCHQRNRLLGRN